MKKPRDDHQAILIITLYCEHDGIVGREIFSFPTELDARESLKDMKKSAKRDGLKLKGKVGGRELLADFEPLH